MKIECKNHANSQCFHKLTRAYLVQFLHDYLFYAFHKICTKIFKQKLFMRKSGKNIHVNGFRANFMRILHQNLHE